MPHLSFSGPCEMNLWLVWVLVSKLLLTDQGVEKREASKYEEGFVRKHGRREWVPGFRSLASAPPSLAVDEAISHALSGGIYLPIQQM